MVREDKIRIPLEDDIWGIEGDWTGNLEKATGIDSDEPLFYVEYVPNIDPNKSVGAWLRTVLPVLDAPIRKTPKPVPNSQINRVNPNSAGSVAGVPSMKLHLKSLSGSDSPWRERIGNKLETEEKKYKDKQTDKESQALVEKAKRLRQGQESEADEDSGRRSGEYLTEEERRMR